MCPVEISEEPQQQSMKELEEQVEYVNANVTKEEVEEPEQLQEGNRVGGENEIECKTKLTILLPWSKCEGVIGFKSSMSEEA